jgi:hypothetical protein
MSKAFAYYYFMDMILVDYHIYVFQNFGIIIEQPSKLFNVNSNKKICDILKLNLNAQNSSQTTNHIYSFTFSSKTPRSCTYIIVNHKQTENTNAQLL